MQHREAFEIAKAELVAWSGGKISATVCDNPGTKAYWICNAVAGAMLELDYQQAEREMALYLDTAEGEDLSELANDRYGVQRHGATAAVVTLAMTRVSTVADLTVHAGTVVRTDDGIKFATDFAFVMAIGDAGPTDVEATGVQTGADQNVDAASLTAFEGSRPQSDMTVTNAEAAAGGNDEETDEALRERVRITWVNARRGTLGAIKTGALEVDEVREAAAYEPLDTNGRPCGWVQLVIADENGDSNATLEAAVELELDDWRAAGIYVGVLGATVVWVDVEVEITWAAGTATRGSVSAVKAAITAAINNLDPNGAATAAAAPKECLVTHGLIEHAARSITGVIDVTVVDPAGTEAPDNGEVLRTNTGRVTVT
ncbi:MAG: baseplate J/gp47 family protein [Gemmatimonadota bacterium]